MNKEFLKAAVQSGDFTSYLGQWLLYDGGLCVNRSLEEHTASYEDYCVSRGTTLAL